MGSMKHRVRDTVNSLLGAYNLELRRPHRGFDEYIPLQPTLLGARDAGLSVGDYIDRVHNAPGATQETMDNMCRMGVFAHTIDRVCEIGPGSGRYLERTLALCKPRHYEIYELAREWAEWLVQTYGVVYYPSDGKFLASTLSGSLDLVHAHKVLPGLPVLTACQYMVEMARVVRKGGKVVFDLLTEDCLQDDLLYQWLPTLTTGGDWLGTMIAKQYAVDLFCKQGFTFDGSFMIAMKPGITQYFVFTRTREDG